MTSEFDQRQPPKFTVPDELVEAAAKALYEPLSGYEGYTWETLPTEPAEQYRSDARSALTAALGLCRIGYSYPGARYHLIKRWLFTFDESLPLTHPPMWLTTNIEDRWTSDG